MQDEQSRGRILIAGYSYIVRRGLASIVCGVTKGAAIAEVSCFDEAKQWLGREDFLAAIFEIDPENPNGPINFQELRLDHPRLILGVISRCDKASTILSHLAAGVNGYILGCSGQVEIESAIETILRGAIYVPPSLVRSKASHPVSNLDVPPTCGHRKGLTGRQSDVLRLLLSGYSNKIIARELDLSPHTVKFHVGALLRHFAVERRTDLSVAAFRRLGDGTYGHTALSLLEAPPHGRIVV
jgi:DNA-binding NarL/FixJ family response regulator